ncbi:hypothetical protein [Thiocapsa marina]|uniref:Uncharacterized protein n=1 Tax=Thiocapsa marina 5811 TaxID=768671 RepID=F9U5N0_9GAMM|nr:hypothetical protein [Thiocapsa marina]EGV20453.1 hypothetical protein ThimaDRAFT_0231 [Thiocapsa marina 5811]
MSQQTNTSALPAERSQAAVALDNLIRRHLRVSDPRDPEAISNALRERYVDEQAALDQEAAGLPFFKVTRIETRAPVETSTSVELKQARDDVSRDLDALVGHALLKNVHPELRGWAQHIRQSVAEGVNAARFALDPWQRDQAMATRRLLGDYARMARFVGALTPGMGHQYRSLAKSLDEVASVILVTIGETIAQAGFGGGRFLLQAPASELQARRDAVINSLRNLIGSRHAVLEQDEWAYGQHALRQVMEYLDGSGLTELRPLFQENHVARVLDELVHWATRGSAEDLRALGATAQLTLGRFRRLIMITKNIPDPPAPPFSAYLDAIRSFLDAFSSGAGYRLLYIARPAIAHYGLYGIGGPDAPSQRMLKLTALRGQLAQALDCYLGCECGSDPVRCQVLLDKVLYDVDRAIDLYVMGTDPKGKGTAEQRAASFGFVIDQLLKDTTEFGSIHLQEQSYFDYNSNEDQKTCVQLRCVPPKSDLYKDLANIRNCLWWHCSPTEENTQPTPFKASALQLMREELCLQRDAEAQWENLLHTMAPTCFNWGTKLDKCTVSPSNSAKGDIEDPRGLLVPTQDLVEAAICAIEQSLGESPPVHCGDLEFGFPETVAHAIGELSGARRPDATRYGETFAEPAAKYLREGLRLTKRQVGAQIILAMPDNITADDENLLIGRLKALFGFSTQATKVPAQRYTIVADNLQLQKAQEIVEQANLDMKQKLFFVSRILDRESDSCCAPVKSENPEQQKKPRASQRSSQPSSASPGSPKQQNEK